MRHRTDTDTVRIHAEVSRLMGRNGTGPKADGTLPSQELVLEDCGLSLLRRIARSVWVGSRQAAAGVKQAGSNAHGGGCLCLYAAGMELGGTCGRRESSVSRGLEYAWRAAAVLAAHSVVARWPPLVTGGCRNRGQQ